MTCRGTNNNPVVILVDGVPTTLKATQELVAAGTVQISPNSETTSQFPDERAVAETQYIIPNA